MDVYVFRMYLTNCCLGSNVSFSSYKITSKDSNYCLIPPPTTTATRTYTLSHTHHTLSYGNVIVQTAFSWKLTLHHVYISFVQDKDLNFKLEITDNPNNQMIDLQFFVGRSKLVQPFSVCNSVASTS